MSMGYTRAETESFGPARNVQSNNTPQTTRQSRPLTPKPSLLNCLSPTILLGGETQKPKSGALTILDR